MQLLVALGFLLLFCNTSFSQSTVHQLPITLEYPLLQHLVIQSAFTEKGNSAILLDEEDGCARILASDPQFSSSENRLRSLTHVSLKLGKSFGNDCFLPIQWEGYLELLHQPKFLPDTFTLALETVDSGLYTNDQKPARVSPFIWNRIRKDVHRYMEQITLDLAPPVNDLKTFLLPLFPPHNQQVAKTALDTMKPGEIVVASDHLKAHVNINLPAGSVPDEEATPEARLTPEEQARFIQIWERWDAFLVHIIIQLTGQNLTLEDRQTLLETLLITRHRFSDALASVGQHRDFVHAQFTDVWQQLAPIFRKTLLRRDGGGLGYLTFFTAADAIIALDTISPAMGFDISSNGLIRLAQILDDTPLQYAPDMDSTLRRILGLSPKPMGIFDEPPEKDIGKPPEPSHLKPLSWLKGFVSAVAWAKKASTAKSLASFTQWLPGSKNRNEYLIKMRMLLNRAATAIHVRKKIPKALYKFYIPLIQATAWQESCYRQFHVKKGAPTYLLSYNGTSVGLMQVNERVWRGIYDIKRLRWDVTYNALAGNEIAALYLKQYVLKRIDNIDALDDKTVAGAVYAVYNGGPGQLKKFLARSQDNKYYLSDRLFLQKWDWVLAKQWNQIDHCLGKPRQ